jgi:hypothetical protein
MCWGQDYTEQKIVVDDGVVALRVTKNEILARHKFYATETEMLKTPLPGADPSNTSSNRDFHQRVTHNLLLTVVMDFQWRNQDFFQSLLLGPKVTRWPRALLLHRNIFNEYSGEGDDMPTTKPHPDPPAPRKRKRKCGPLGLRNRLTNYRPKEEQGVKRKRSALPANGQGWEVDSPFDTSENPALPQSKAESEEEPAWEEEDPNMGDFASDWDTDDSTVKKKSIRSNKRTRLLKEEASDGEAPPTYETSTCDKKMKAGRQAKQQPQESITTGNADVAAQRFGQDSNVVGTQSDGMVVDETTPRKKVDGF